VKIACWSGPRNLSTAMMYAFGNRADCAAVDEPFYAAYLARTGLPHPMRDAVLASQSQDPAQVIADLTGPVPGGLPHVYHKHMAQHMITGIPRDWMGGMAHLILLRHPARVVASFAKGYAHTTLDDVGFVQLAGIYDDLLAQGLEPVVVDSADIRRAPERMLRLICDRIGLSWDPAMLSWPAGPKPFDGVWAAHWYGAVHGSTWFAGPEGALPNLSGDLAGLVEAAMPFYDRLAAVRIG